MGSDRADILARIKQGQGLGSGDPLATTIPKAEIDGDVHERFLKRLEVAGVTVFQLGSIDKVPAKVLDILTDEKVSPSLVMGRDPRLAELNWSSQLDVRTGVAQASTTVGLSHAFMGIAESGTLVLLSGPENPSTNNFLVDLHLVVVQRKDLVSHMEGVWQALANLKDGLPRGVHFISAPSSTADIALKSQTGVHGPRRLFVLLIGPHKV